ncbi:hypothetical protein [Enterococcus sp. 2201sp1_2201st1_B8_2201SCRN_220225]|uniref:hypothetical protein n=1 Tax=unclassified Enterococcus TaxID=2608891 RepID=UPI0034A19C33
MNENILTKKEFKEKMGYSESTYSRRMKKFKVPKYLTQDGYIMVTKSEVYINTEIYDQFLRDESAKRLHYQRI